MSTMLHHISFFTAKFKFFPRIFQIYSWFCKEVLSFQTRSLGVTTPHITPVLYRNWVCSLNFQVSQVLAPQLRVEWIFFFVINFFFFYFILLNFYLCIYVFIFYFLSFVAVDFVLIFYWPICCLCVCAFKLIFFFASLFILCAVFISLRVGLGLIFRWLEIKISCFGIVYKFLSVGMELVVV